MAHRGTKLTFVVHDSYLNKAHMCQHRTYRRTLEEAWEEYRDIVCTRRWNVDREDAADRFTMIGAIKGLVQFMPEAPLRAPTREEVRELSKQP